ncbi:hypothetical protein C1646_773693 [Rhizophagus diaphanus]|nr:hypothetical protein C1646_773693 [Rhizophagus diaphanus] [Rhizophagus sp. MUCL 43196]
MTLDQSNVWYIAALATRQANRFWIVIPPHKQYCKPGNPVAFNSIIELKHQQTSRNLHSHGGITRSKQLMKILSFWCLKVK